MQYQLIYPDGDVTLAELAKAALAECGSEHVSIVSGMGTQVIRVREDCADRVMERAGLAPAAEPDATTPKTASGAGAETPTPDASTAADADTNKPGRPAGRAAGSTPAAKTATRRQSRRKEG